MRVCLKCYGVQTAFRKGSFNRRRIINCPDKSFWGVIWRETFVKFHRRNAVVRATKGVKIVNWNKTAKKKNPQTEYYIGRKDYKTSPENT